MAKALPIFWIALILTIMQLALEARAEESNCTPPKPPKGGDVIDIDICKVDNSKINIEDSDQLNTHTAPTKQHNTDSMEGPVNHQFLHRGSLEWLLNQDLVVSDKMVKRLKSSKNDRKFNYRGRKVYTVFYPVTEAEYDKNPRPIVKQLKKPVDAYSFDVIGFVYAYTKDDKPTNYDVMYGAGQMTGSVGGEVAILIDDKFQRYFDSDSKGFGLGTFISSLLSSTGAGSVNPTFGFQNTDGLTTGKNGAWFVIARNFRKIPVWEPFSTTGSSSEKVEKEVPCKEARDRIEKRAKVIRECYKLGLKNLVRRLEYQKDLYRTRKCDYSSRWVDEVFNNARAMFDNFHALPKKAQKEYRKRVYLWMSHSHYLRKNPDAMNRNIKKAGKVGMSVTQLENWVVKQTEKTPSPIDPAENIKEPEKEKGGNGKKKPKKSILTGDELLRNIK